MTEVKPAKDPWFRRIAIWLTGIFFGLVLVGALLGPVTPTPRKASESAAMQTTRALALAMFQYANDNGGRCPTGKSSTEVFQKLLDGNYVVDPAIFFLSMPGKEKATTNHLKPENVAFDVTADLTDKMPDDVPVVFCTGYKIEYKPSGRALRLPDRLQPDCCKDGIAVAYHGNNAFYKSQHTDTDGKGNVANFIPEKANIGPGPYIQLTPYGPLISK